MRRLRVTESIPLGCIVSLADKITCDFAYALRTYARMDPIRGRTFDNDSGVKICKNIDREPRGAIDVAFVTEPSQAAAREPDEQIICLKVERNVTRERERERERGGGGRDGERGRGFDQRLRSEAFSRQVPAATQTPRRSALNRP